MGNYVTYAAYRIITGIVDILPLTPVCFIGAIFGQLAYFCVPKRRAKVIRNLRIAFGKKKDITEIKQLTHSTFRHTGMNLAASLKSPSLSAEKLKEHVTLEGTEHFYAARKNTHGCILLVAHMGNWELLTRLTLLMPELAPLASLYRPLDNPLLDQHVHSLRSSCGTQLFSRRDGFTSAIKHLRQNGVLGVIADQNAGQSGTCVPLFGKLTSMTNLPALLHRKTKASILPVSMTSSSPGHWTVKAHAPILHDPDNPKDTHTLTIACAQCYQTIMSENPADVFWMHGYWSGSKRRALRMRGLAKRGIKQSLALTTQPFRALVYLPSNISQHLINQSIAQFRSCRQDLHLTIVAPQDIDGADHSVVYEPSDPPHVIANQLSALDASHPAPFDTFIDLSDDLSGSTIFKHMEATPVFALAKPRNPVHGNYEERVTTYVQTLSPSRAIDD